MKAPPFRRILIANRGEIAVRIARTCRAMGISTVAVYSDADAGALHTRACDLAERIGPAPARESYLNIDALVDAARRQQAEAIHPGYGFLSENARFAEACAKAGVVFIGPPPSAMKAMGDKIAAKRTVGAAGVPTVPGYLGDDQSIETLKAQARRIGAPVLVKAAAGGGGKGMRVVTDMKEFTDAVEAGKREARAAFGDDTLFLEKYLDEPRHIEFQILADAHGHCIHLGERECSIQRRHQKLLEETPSTALWPALRVEMGDAAVRAATSVGYVGAGTVEFMLDSRGRYYFLEMNTRLQVEHPITEAVVGVDLVREQISIAAGRPLSLAQGDVAGRGHAIEVRIYAEDAENDFLPCAGSITQCALPQGPGIRNDVGIESGSVVPPEYDPLLGKLIVSDHTREHCIGRLRVALEEYGIGGVTTNLPFLRWLARNDAFARGETTTAFVARNFSVEALRGERDVELAFLAAAGALQEDAASRPRRRKQRDPWLRLGPWRPSYEERVVRFAAPHERRVVVSPSTDARSWRCEALGREALVSKDSERAYAIEADGGHRRFWFVSSGSQLEVVLDFRYELRLAAAATAEDAAKAHGHAHHGGASAVQAPMTGSVVKVNVRKGDSVGARQVLVVMEAMKMEHAIAAPYAGTVSAVAVKPGDSVNAKDVLVEVEHRSR